MRLTVLLGCPLALVALEAGSPARGADGIAAQVAVTHAFFDEALVGTRVVGLPRQVHQTTTAIGVSYRLPQTNFVVDGRSGFGRMTGSAEPATELLDSAIGLTWVVPGLAPLGLRTRMGIILPGSYEVLEAESFGVGAGAVEASIAISHPLTEHGLRAMADLGYRLVGEDAPDRLVGSFGVAQRWIGMEAALAYRHDHSLSGHDFGEGSPQGVRRIAGFAEISLGRTLGTATQAHVAVAKAIQGRNKAEKTQVSVVLDHRF